jgi:hypothetical protein
VATSDQIAELRRLINEPDESVYSDIVLAARLDEEGSTINGTASSIWREKAATYASLIDVQEGNSNRKLSQLQVNALKMAEAVLVGDSGEAITGTSRPARTRQIERQ